jgi:iron complex outermembrane receptor protein
LILIGILSPIAALAEPQPAREDLDTIFVIAAPNERFGPVSETHHRLEEDAIAALAPIDAADLLRRLPSAQAPTNSRGETLIYLRNAGERQIAVFFDGALLNVPWDNRYDLGVFPASVIGGVISASGTLSPQYGVNALGAVALFPTRGEADTRLNVQGGTQGRRAAEFSAGGALGAARVLASFVYSGREGESLSNNADLSFHQIGERLRTNTDQNSYSGFARAEAEIGDAEIAATLLVSRTARGIAPESDRADARFWRYPEIQTIMGIVSGSGDVGASTDLQGSVWVQDFEQTIDSFETAAYETIEDTQRDNDRTYGVRAISRSKFETTLVTASVNFLASRHRQRDTAFVAGAPLAPDDSVFAQRAASAGVDLEHFLTDAFQIDFGAGVDFIDYTETGGRPDIDPFTEPVLRAGLSWSATDRMRLRAAVGQKSRMPTLRELFGTALNRFLTNPDLEPERVRTTELGLNYDDDRLRFAVVAFGQNVENTIDQRNVGSLRQRINLEGSWVAGVEASGDVDLSAHWRLSGSATYAKTRRKDAADDGSKLLAERPSFFARAALDYTHPKGARAGIEVLHTGRAFSVNEAGFFEPLEISTQLNLHAAYPLPLKNVALYVRADNVTDVLAEPQIGLPAPGRSIKVGFRAAL